MNILNDEELLQLAAECGVTIHESVHALSAYERECISVSAADMQHCVSVPNHMQQTGAKVHAYY
jgi:hypothetical protein